MNNNNCLANILNVITIIQNNAQKLDCSNNCTRPFLGETTNNTCFNTRLVTLYRCDNSLVTLPYTLNGVDGTSTVFRVENVEGNCATFRVLIPNTTEEET